MMKKAVKIFIVLSAIVGTATTVRAEGDKGLIGITIIIVICVIVTSVILNRTKFGRGMYAIGGNRNAAIYAGIKVRKITCLVFVMTGVLSAMSGIMLASRVYSGQPAAANGYEGNAIAAAVLGGVSFSGGVGTIGGVLIGVFIIGFMNNGLNMLHVTSYWQIIVKGLLILFAVYLDTLRSSKRLKIKRKG